MDFGLQQITCLCSQRRNVRGTFHDPKTNLTHLQNENEKDNDVFVAVNIDDER